MIMVRNFLLSKQLTLLEMVELISMSFAQGFYKIRKVLDTTGGKFYIHKDSKKFHSGYSPSDENLITDFLLIEYLIGRIETYIKRCEEDVERNKNLLIEIQNKK